MENQRSLISKVGERVSYGLGDFVAISSIQQCLHSYFSTTQIMQV